MGSSSILIVDDDVDLAEIVRAVLESVGYRCRWAANGREALDEAAVATPGLVLVDMLMPLMNGWECVQRLREMYGHTLPIVVMTAAEHADSRGEEVDADAVLTKPFDIDKLIRVVQRYVPPPTDAAPRRAN